MIKRESNSKVQLIVQPEQEDKPRQYPSLLFQPEWESQMGNYTQLTDEQRYQLAAYLEAGLTKQEMADFLGVRKTTVY